MEISERFRGYLPVVVDLETGGFSKESNPVLEIACTFLTMNEDELSVKRHVRWDVNPFPNSIIDPASLKVTKIDLDDPDRNGIDEKDALTDFFREVREEMKVSGCHRASNGGAQRFLRSRFYQHGLRTDSFKAQPISPLHCT